MRTVPIVALDEGGQGRGPARLALPGAPVLPLLGEGAVHALDLPVLPGAVGARVLVLDPAPLQQGVELAAPVAGAVVGHHALYADAQAAEEREAARHERRTGALSLVGQQLGVGDAGEVVDGHVEARGARAAPRAAPAPEGAVASAVRYPRHLLDVDVDELSLLTPIWRATSRMRSPPATRETSVSRPLGVSLALGCWDMGGPLCRKPRQLTACGRPPYLSSSERKQRVGTEHLGVLFAVIAVGDFVHDELDLILVQHEVFLQHRRYLFV